MRKPKGILLVAVLLALVGCGDDGEPIIEPTATIAPTGTATPSATRSLTATTTPSTTCTATNEPTRTATPTATMEPTLTSTPTVTETATTVPSHTSTPTVTPSPTLEPTPAPTATVTRTFEPGTIPATFSVAPGVEQVTVTNAPPRAHLTLYGGDGTRLLTLIADEFGQAHFALIPDEYLVIETGPQALIPTSNGGSLKRGDGYMIRMEDVEPVEVFGPFSVLGREDVAPDSFYASQVVEDGFGYIEMRDGVKLSIMVRFPSEGLAGPPPWPTVVEYSGYAPSNPANPEPGSRIANLLGYVSVGVNMRGTGCSGGVFDVFNPAQHADGYDVIEVLARQPWVLHGHVGMVGLSYAGISQLYVASTNPPSLAAITPLSVIEDPWRQQWPGGVYNDGFTRQWLDNRDSQAAPGGQSWVTRRVENGDEICEENLRLSNQNLDFEAFARALEFYPPDAADRRPGLLVSDITTPVYLTGAFQDEQTGARFGTMLDKFTSTDRKKFILYNGRHPDGYSPMVLNRWFEFLEFYVAERIPFVPPLLRALSHEVFEETFGVPGLTMEEDRFLEFGSDYAAALEAYESEPLVHVFFENGAGDEIPGAPVARFETFFDRWPPSEAEPWILYLGPGESLREDPPDDGAIDVYAHDPDAGPEDFFGRKGYQLLAPIWDFDWQRFEEGKGLSYLTAPLTEDLVVAGAGYASLWFASDADDANIEVNVMEVRTDGTEYLVQSGWLRAGHRKIDESASDDFRIERTYDEVDFAPLDPGVFVEAVVAIPPVAHAFRAGSQIRLTIETPGRNHGTWTFENPEYETEVFHQIARTIDMPSFVLLPLVGGIDVAEGLPPCPSLRGQPCRDFVPVSNSSRE